MRAIAALVASLCAVATVTAQDEVPFVTTPDNVTVAMLELAGVGPRDHVIDLGSGDGRIVITAARRFGASGLGVEIVVDLVGRSREAARVAGVSERVEFREQDLFATDLSRASVVTMYLLPDVNLQLRPRLLALAPGTRIVSHDWDLGEWRPDRTIVVDAPEKAIGREKRSTLMLWTVPAPVHGLWCSARGTLEITQRFQDFSATLIERGRSTPAMVFDGAVQGPALTARGHSLASIEWRAGQLAVLQIGAAGSAFETTRFSRAAGASCP